MRSPFAALVLALLFLGMACTHRAPARDLSAFSGRQPEGKAVLLFEIRPGAGFRIDPASPVKLTLRSVNLLLDKTELSRSDARQQAASMVFEVPVRPQGPGPASLHAEALFFVCSETRCVRQVRSATVHLSTP